jgi:K(+)-stimulated pyrophosphate-energized sodium pump
MSFNALVPVVFGAIGLIVAYFIYQKVREYPEGESKVVEIGEEIHLGAMVFMRREYLMLFWFALVLFLILLFAPGLGVGTAMAFLVGALTSAGAGYIGMNTATRANVRTTTAAHTKGPAEALTVAFFGGSIMGLAVASLGLLGLGTLYLFFGGDPETAHTIHGFGMGASSVALFSRVGGGIFTKSADVGADLVGKLEAGIPEDDPRNPGVIADNVGDNVGDVAGMGSDIFESYCGAIIATIAMASTIAADIIDPLGERQALMFLPLALASLGLVCSIVGIFLVRRFSARKPEVALRIGTIGATVAFIVLSYLVIVATGVSAGVWGAVIFGAFGGIIIGLVTEYYTSSSPVRHIAKQGETGAATVIIAGLAIGMKSVAIPMLTICAIIAISTQLVGLYGVGIAAVGMLATVGITMAITAYVETVAARMPGFSLELSDPMVLIGLFMGGILPFLIGAMTMEAVGDAAFEMINEIRRQFREITGLLEGTAKPDTARCVDIATTAALKKMVPPGVLAVAAPWIVGLGLGPEALGGLLGGALLGCVLLALTMANAGGAWDNAKKYVEKGHHGGKGSDTHTATVVGDTVGDPFKDTSGPSMNILINVMAIVSLVIAPLLG